MDNDLKSLRKHIESNQIKIADLRQQAQGQRVQNENTSENNQFYLQQAEVIDHQARELEDENEQLENHYRELEAKIATLQNERDTLARESGEKITQLDNELTRLRGSIV